MKKIFYILFPLLLFLLVFLVFFILNFSQKEAPGDPSVEEKKSPLFLEGDDNLDPYYLYLLDEGPRTRLTDVERHNTCVILQYFLKKNLPMPVLQRILRFYLTYQEAFTMQDEKDFLQKLSYCFLDYHLSRKSLAEKITYTFSFTRDDEFAFLDSEIP